jgi:hypothetical protein
MVAEFDELGVGSTDVAKLGSPESGYICLHNRSNH